MVDPITIISAAASVSSIVDLLGKTVSTLQTLHSRWKEADFKFINLIAQLIALKAALSKLQEWMDTDVDEPHHQLAMDLDASVTCCKMLVRRIDSEVEDLQQKSGAGLDTQSKIKLLIKNGTLEELQKMVDRQTGALTLLLTVCNYKSIGEQKIMLEKTSTRRVIKRVKDDTSSLYVQRDSTSIYSRYTDNLSKISKMFEFDRELFISKVYEKALWSSLKDTVENIRQKQHWPDVKVSRNEMDRNVLIDRIIKSDAARMKQESRILLLGERNCVQIFIKYMKIRHIDGFTDDDRRMYKEVVMTYIMQVIEGIVLVQENGDIDLDNGAKIQAKLLSQEIKAIRASGKITIEGAGIAQGLWKDILERGLKYKEYIPDLSSYFIEEIQRIAQKDYLPTDADILKLAGVTPDISGVQEHRLDTGGLSLRMFDASSQRSEKKKWIHQFEGCISIVFFVDISQYDEYSPEEPNKIIESLSLFESVINSRWFHHTSVILLLCNVERFKQKLQRNPLVNCFPDYASGSDFKKAAKYIIRRFNHLNHGHLDLYPHFCDPSDDYMRLICSVVKESIMQNHLRSIVGARTRKAEASDA